MALEQLAHVRHIALDKTGTLTEGKPEVVDVVAFEGTASDILILAAAVEQGSRHPLAQAVVRKAQQLTPEGGLAFPEAEHVNAQAGKGVSGVINGKTIAIGSPKTSGECCRTACNRSRPNRGPRGTGLYRDCYQLRPQPAWSSGH